MQSSASDRTLAFSASSSELKVLATAPGLDECGATGLVVLGICCSALCLAISDTSGCFASSFAVCSAPSLLRSGCIVPPFLRPIGRVPRPRTKLASAARFSSSFARWVAFTTRASAKVFTGEKCSMLGHCKREGDQGGNILVLSSTSSVFPVARPQSSFFAVWGICTSVPVDTDAPRPLRRRAADKGRPRAIATVAARARTAASVVCKVFDALLKLAAMRTRGAD